MLTQVELPLAMNVIVAGVRVATVISIGTATIAAAIGAAGWVLTSSAAYERWIER
jgi:osmoprotectant transport system permease protein